MFYYFLLIVAYAVMTILSAKPIWAFLGVTFNERNFDPTVMGDFSHIKIALIIFIVISILIGIISRKNYDYYFNKKFDGKWLPELKGKLTRRYLVVVIGSFAMALLVDTTTEQGYLADIEAGFGLGKTVLFLVLLILVGWVLCLGKLLFVKKPKAAVFEHYDKQDLLFKQGKNYRKLTDEELFPALMKKTPSERLKGKLAEDYKKEVLALGEKYLGDYREMKYISKPEEYESYKNLCRSASNNRCWVSINEWLNEVLKKPDKVDSFPDAITDFGTAPVHCSFTTPNAVGMAKAEAQKRAVKDAMDQWNEKRDSRERMVNAVLSGDLRTDTEQYLGGGLSERTYMEGQFQRDVAEAEVRRRIESETYTNDYDLVDVSEFDDEITLSMDYFRSLGLYIDMVKEDWDQLARRSVGVGIPRFYQMLWPVYVAGHPENTKAPEQFKGVRRNFFYAVGCMILFLVLKVITDKGAEVGGIMSMLNIVLTLIGLGAVLATLVLLFMAVLDLKNCISGLKESNIKNVKKQAASCAPALYRQLRFYKLWKNDDPAVCALEGILNKYFETVE